MRDSARFVFDQDWLKHGSMARFAFLPEDPMAQNKAQIIQATNELAADMHGVSSVLRSTKLQLEALK